MSRPRITESDIGSFYVDEAAGDVWQLVAYSDQPTATLEKVAPPKGLFATNVRVGGVVGAPIFDGFRRLVPEDPA